MELENGVFVAICDGYVVTEPFQEEAAKPRFAGPEFDYVGLEEIAIFVDEVGQNVFGGPVVASCIVDGVFVAVLERLFVEELLFLGLLDGMARNKVGDEVFGLLLGEEIQFGDSRHVFLFVNQELL